MESRIEIVKKDPNPLNELMVVDLAFPYARIHTIEGSTMLDLHLKIQEAETLHKKLKEYLENQVVSPSVDR